MIKVFLVEDEFIIRNGIRNKIPWEQEGMRLCGEAEDGELAYPLIMKERPDILITDIRMPFLDGLELSRLLRKELPNLKIIIISGYGDFEYARQAISLGVTEYLLKPVNSAQMVEVLRRVSEQIKKEQSQKHLLMQYQLEMQENTEKERYHLLKKLFTGDISMAEALEVGKCLEMDLTAPCFSILLFKVYGQSTTDYQYCKEAVSAISEMQQELKGEDVMLFEWPEDSQLFLLKGEDEDSVEGTYDILKEKLHKVLEHYPQLSYFGGKGCTVKRLRNLRLSYEEASRAYACRFFTDANQIVDVGFVDSLARKDDSQIDIRSIDFKAVNSKQVNSFFKEGTAEEAGHFIEEYFQEVGESNYKSFMLRQYLAIDIYFCAVRFLEELELELEALPSKYQDIRVLPEYLDDIEILKTFLRELFEEVIALRDGRAQKKYNHVIKKACDYMEENYNSSDISLNQIAEYVNISPCYFSNLFRQEVGKTFIEYLTEVRMRHAKELLRCTNKRSSEIAEIVGYQDSHYFSFLFKKTQKITPSEYRRQKK